MVISRFDFFLIELYDILKMKMYIEEAQERP